MPDNESGRSSLYVTLLILAVTRKGPEKRRSSFHNGDVEVFRVEEHEIARRELEEQSSSTNSSVTIRYEG